jgi:hydroxymethylbilane synthase
MTFALAAESVSLQNCLEEKLKQALFVQKNDVTDLDKNIVTNSAINLLFFGTNESAEQAVLDGQAQASVHFLSTLSTTRTAGLRIGAVLPRMPSGYTLCVWKKYADDSKILKLPDAAQISVSNAFEAAQLLDFRSDFEFRYENTDVFIKKTQKRAFLLPNFLLSQINTDDYMLIELDKSELVPPPAHGVVALQYNKYDTDTEDFLRHKLHDKTTLTNCNIERETQQMIGDEATKNKLGLYCEIDENGNYHASCAWVDTDKKSLGFFKISQNTRHSLAKAIQKKITNMA